MPAEWALSIVVPIYKGKGDIGKCSCHRVVWLLQHGMKVVVRVLEKRLCRILTVDEMQFGFMPERGIIDAVFILRTLQEDYYAKGNKLYMCLVDLERVLEWAMRKKGILEVLV